MKEKIRIVLVDDHPVVLAGLRHLVGGEEDFEVLGEATSGLGGLKIIRESRPDVAVIDISLPELNGVALTRRLAAECPAIRVLILTFREERAYVTESIQAGARGYVLKRSAPERLVQAIRAVFLGVPFIDPAIAGEGLGSRKTPAARRGAPSTLPGLTDRETEVLRLSALGYTNKEIAARIGVGVKSIETYKSRASEKLGLRTRAEIVRYASARGWLADA
ncbi:MAG TPA: response regulator transcription factor [Xanthobacteraceae bacterium]